MAANDSSSAKDSIECIPDNIGLHFLPEYKTLSKTVLDRGLNKFLSHFIHNVRVFSGGDGDKVEVSARCYRSMSKMADPHTLCIELGTDTVTEARCSCKAGLNGHCSHIIGLLKTMQYFKLQNFTHVPDKLSCTSMPQAWGAAATRGNKLLPMPINHIVLARPSENRKRKPIMCQVDTDNKIPKVTSDDISTLQLLHGTPLTYLLTPNAPTMTTPLGEVQIGSALSYQTRNLKPKMMPVQQQKCGNINVCRKSPVDLPQEFSNLCNMPCINPEKLEEKTRDQAQNSEWMEERKKRLTASNFHRVVIRKAQFTEKFLKSIFCPDAFTTAATTYGTRHEDAAKKKYLEMFPDRHLHKCGLVVNLEFPFLGASPDGKVCHDGQTGIIEIKCPYSSRNATILEACALPNFCLEISNENQVQLNKKHAYYTQIQGQLMLTGCDFCDFIVYTQRECHVERVTPDLTFMSLMLSKLALFFRDHAKKYFDKN